MNCMNCINCIYCIFDYYAGVNFCFKNGKMISNDFTKEEDIEICEEYRACKT